MKISDAEAQAIESSGPHKPLAEWTVAEYTAALEAAGVRERLRTEYEIASSKIRECSARKGAALGCPCGHGPDDICLNGAIYGNCGDENCGGGCDPDAGTCRSLPGCCDVGLCVSVPRMVVLAVVR